MMGSATAHARLAYPPQALDKRAGGGVQFGESLALFRINPTELDLILLGESCGAGVRETKHLIVSLLEASTGPCRQSRCVK